MLAVMRLVKRIPAPSGLWNFLNGINVLSQRISPSKFALKHYNKNHFKVVQIPHICGIIDLRGLMPLSGKEMLKLYEKAGWTVLRQKGSHVIVGRGADRETIPLHKELKNGLERALLKKLGK